MIVLEILLPEPISTLFQIMEFSMTTLSPILQFRPMHDLVTFELSPITVLLPITQLALMEAVFDFIIFSS